MRNLFINRSVGSSCTRNDRENSNGHLYPDFLYDKGTHFVIIEVDEHKHRGSAYECDDRRMLDIIANLGQPCIFIRYNPDNRSSDKAVLLETVKECLDIIIKHEDQWEENGFDKHGLSVKYLFYD